MNIRYKTAYCGIYCPDCILYQNEYSPVAAQLKELLSNTEMRDYAAVASPFGTDFKDYPAFEKILGALAEVQCEKTCRVGGGCSGTPCEIMKCCYSKGFGGCWECEDVEECDKFDFLTPRCGDMPKNNIRTIKVRGIKYWEKDRDKFYVWQK